jgi:protein Tex
MRPLVWWVQDHLGLAAISLLGIAAIAAAIIFATSGGSSEAPGQRSQVVASPSSAGGQAVAGGSASRQGRHRAQAGGGEHAQGQGAAPRHSSAAGHDARGGQGPKGGRDSRDHRTENTTGANAGAANHGTSNSTKPQQPTSSAKHSLGKAAADQVAAAHPGASCPKSYSRKQCEQAVEAAANPSPSTVVTQPSDCGKAMSEAQCEALFAAEAQARANGSGSVSPQECIEHPELEACAAVVEEMKAQYEVAHPGG